MAEGTLHVRGEFAMVFEGGQCHGGRRVPSKGICACAWTRVRLGEGSGGEGGSKDEGGSEKRRKKGKVLALPPSLSESLSFG